MRSSDSLAPVPDAPKLLTLVSPTESLGLLTQVNERSWLGTT